MARQFVPGPISPVQDRAAQSLFSKILPWITQADALFGANFAVSSTGAPSVIQPSGPSAFDHGALTGLLDDDHPQYLTAARAQITRAAELPIDSWTQANGTVMTSGFLGSYPGKYNRWEFWPTPATKPQGLFRFWRVPNDYISGGRMVLLYTTRNITPDDGPFEMRLHYWPVADVDEDDIADQISVVGGITTIVKVSTNVGLLTPLTPRAVQAAQRVARLDMGSDMADLAAGKLVSLTIDRNVDSASDTYADAIQLLGVYITYLAST